MKQLRNFPDAYEEQSMQDEELPDVAFPKIVCVSSAVGSFEEDASPQIEEISSQELDELPLEASQVCHISTQEQQTSDSDVRLLG